MIFDSIEGVPKFECEEYGEKRTRYCICIPIINEGARIKAELLRAQQHGIADLCDIIICDGGSTDGCTNGELLKSLGVNALLTKRDAGKQGAQLRMGFWWALNRGYDGLITIDGNNKDSIEDVPKLIEKLDAGYDFVQGSRFIKGGHAIHTPIIRWLSVKLIHAPVISITAKQRFTDSTNAFRAYSRRYLEHPEVQPLRDVFMTYELLAYLSVRASQLGLRTCEVPVTRAYPKGEKTPTKISPLKGSVALLEILCKNSSGAYNPRSNRLRQEPNKSFNLKVLPISIYLSSVLLYLFNALKNESIRALSFDRIIGNGILQGIDITKRIHNFYVWYLVLAPVVFLSVFFMLNKLYHRSIENKREQAEAALIFLNTTSVVAMVSMFFIYLSKFVAATDLQGYSLFQNFSVTLPLCLIAAVLAFIILIKHLSVPFETFKWSMFLSVSLSFPVLFLFKSLQEYSYHQFITAFFLLAAFIVLITNKLIEAGLLNEQRIKRVQMSAIPLMYGLLGISLFLELANILNQYNLIIHHKRLISLFVYVILGIVSILLYLTSGKFNLLSFRWENYYYPALILSFSFIMVQPALQNFVAADLFESANHGLAVSEFFRFGKIPLIETFDAHMLSNSLWGFLYGILNNDTFGAMFIVYGVYIAPILALLFYKIIKEFFDCDFVFLLVILLPAGLAIIYADFAFLAIICLLFALRKNTFGAYLCYWFSLVGICLYRLDSGAAYSFATVVTLLLAYFLTNGRYNLKKAGLALLSTLLGCGGVYLSICVSKGINPLIRLQEVLGIAGSNVNWAYAELGNPSLFSFPFCYIIIPFAVVTISICMVYMAKIRKLKINVSQGVIATSLAIAYLFNLSRGMVRHSLLEMQIDLVLFSSIMFIALSISLFRIKYKKECFLAVLIPLAVVSGLLTSDLNIKAAGIADGFFNKATASSLFDVTANQKVQRVVLTDEFKNSYVPAVDFINSIMKSEETYLDFTNQSLLYAFSGKEKPVYINQSPGLLSGEFTQRQFIDQVESKKDSVIFALMPVNNMPFAVSLDEIHNSFRYYLVSEYISKKFMPLCTFSDYALWVRKDKYDEVYARCAEIKSPYTYCDYNYGAIEVLHTYDLKQIPYIWGTYDKKQAINNKVFENAIRQEDDCYVFDFDKISKESGNYILIKAGTDIPTQPETNETEKCMLTLGSTSTGEFIPRIVFSFDLREGTDNAYLIRVSSDFYWYTDLIDCLKIESSTELKDLNLQILQGD